MNTNLTGRNAIPADPEPAEVRLFTVGTKYVEVRVGENYLSFGSKSCQNKVHLNSFGAVMGFYNGLFAMMDNGYPILENGFHSKVGWEQIKSTFEMDDAAYVNFDILSDPVIKQNLAEYGIGKQEGKYGWLSLKVSHRRLFPAHPITPRTKDQLVKDIGKPAEEISPFSFANNKKAWRTLFKHEGIDMGLALLNGDLRVIVKIDHYDDDGLQQETQQRILAERFELFWATREERAEVLKGAVVRGREAERAQKVGYIYTKHQEAVPAAIKALTEQGKTIFILNGETEEEKEVSLPELIGARVKFVSGTTELPGTSLLRTIGDVQFALQKCARAGQMLKVVA